MISLVRDLYEKKKAKKWWRDILTRDTLVDPPLARVDTLKDIEFEDRPTLDYNWRTL